MKVALANLVYLVTTGSVSLFPTVRHREQMSYLQKNDGIGTSCFTQRLHDGTWTARDVRSPVAPDLGLIPDAAE